MYEAIGNEHMIITDRIRLDDVHCKLASQNLLCTWKNDIQKKTQRCQNGDKKQFHWQCQALWQCAKKTRFGQ